MAVDKGRRGGGGGGVRGKKGQSPPILSHEFFIQNHGDIVSCVIMVIMLGLMFNITAPMSKMFIMPQHNETIPVAPPPANTANKDPTASTSTITQTSPEANQPTQLILYRSGPRDSASLFFYTLTWIAVHCAVQEYVVDKFQRRYNLSKTKRSKLSESIHLLAFGLYSIVHIGYIVQQLNLVKEMPLWLWQGYPDSHRMIPLASKLFFIFQISYWLHQFPEFYFQKLKRDEIKERAVYTVFFLSLISLAYFTNFHRLALALLLLEYTSQSLLHFARILKFTDRNKQANKVFQAYNITFVLVRLATLVISVLTLWYGLSSIETPFVDFDKGNFNTSTIRLNALVVIVLLQLYMLFNFSTFHFSRFRSGSSRGGGGGGGRAAQQQTTAHSKSD